MKIIIYQTIILIASLFLISFLRLDTIFLYNIPIVAWSIGLFGGYWIAKIHDLSSERRKV
jgi:hypothetical protein